MWITIFFSSLSFFIGTTTARAVTYEELCRYDPTFCTRLRDASGNPVKPLPEIVAVLKQLNPQIQETATKYGVDPRAVIGSILAENSLNVTKDRQAIKEFLYSTQLESLWKLKTGHLPSLGLGQINPDAAMAVEPLAARIEGRAVRDQDQVIQALRDPVESVHYSAAIMRNAQDTYKKAGFDISGNPGLLTTVYNLGRESELAQKAKAENRDPKVNFFGFFVDENLSTINEIASTKEKPRAAHGTARLINGGALNVLPHPPDCKPGRVAAAHDFSRDTTLIRPEVSGKAQGFFNVIGAGVDCDMQPWTAISASNGVTGWVSNAELEKRSQVMAASNLICSQAAIDSCKSQVDEIVKPPSTLGMNPSGIQLMSLNSKDPKAKTSFKGWNPEMCLRNRDGMGGAVGLNNSPRNLSLQGSPGYGGYGMGGMYGSTLSGGGLGWPTNGAPSRTPPPVPGAIPAGPVQLTPAEVKSYSERVQKKRDALVAQFGQKTVEGMTSPLQLVFAQFSMAGLCADSATCTGDKAGIEGFLNADLAAAFKSYQGLKALRGKYDELFFVEPTMKQPDLLQDVVKKVDQDCGQSFSNFPDIARMWQDYKSSTAANRESNPNTYVMTFATSPDAICRRFTAISKRAKGVPCELATNSVLELQSVSDAMIESPDDQKAYLKDQLEQFILTNQLRAARARPVAMFADDDDRIDPCNYDPISLLKDVDKISALACVDAVMMPDQRVLQRYVGQSNKKVILGNFENEGNYGIKFKGACPKPNEN